MGTSKASHTSPCLLGDVIGAGSRPGLYGAFQSLLTLGWMQRHLVLPALGAAIVLAVLALLPPIMLAHLIDKVFQSGNVAACVAVGAGIACIALIDGACSLVRRILAMRAALRLQQGIMEPAFSAVLRLPMDHPLVRDQGLIGRTLEESERLARGATEELIEFGMAAGMIAVFSIALLYVDLQVGLAVMGIVACLSASHLLLARTVRTREVKWFESRSLLWSHIVEAIAYAHTIRVNSAHRFAQDRFSDRLEKDIGAHRAVMIMSAGLDAGGRFAGGLIIAAIALIGGLRVIGGTMSVGDFVLLLSVGGSLSTPALGLVKSLDDFQAMTVAVARLQALAEAPQEDLPVLPEARRRGGARLQIDGLQFSYADNASPVIAGLSCAFEAGERIALIGPSGIGKSTLASLIFGARKPASGDIRLDGTSIAQIPLSVLRQKIVIVPHEIDIFTGSVTDNIALDPLMTDRRAIENAAAMACLDNDIRALPQGYDTQLGQGGVDLSAGQKQRLGIARALLRRPDILILDESTSSLDLETERRVLDRLLQSLQDVTIIAVTHRTSVVERMDRCVQI